MIFHSYFDITRGYPPWVKHHFSLPGVPAIACYRCRTWTPRRKRRKRRPTSAPPSEGKNGPPCADIYIYRYTVCVLKVKKYSKTYQNPQMRKRFSSVIFWDMQCNLKRLIENNIQRSIWWISLQLGGGAKVSRSSSSIAFRTPAHWLPPGELTFCHGKSPFLMGKSTINGHFQLLC